MQAALFVTLSDERSFKTAVGPTNKENLRSTTIPRLKFQQNFLLYKPSPPPRLNGVEGVNGRSILQKDE
jgi:hypothetical protein